jgi:hypothetical protein
MNSKVIDMMDGARNAMTESAFQQVGSVLSEAKNCVREESQRKSSFDVKMLIDKLEAGEPLSPTDLATVRAWVVGDAESYTKMENNFQDWLAEYDRLEQAMADYANKDCSPDDLLKLEAILEDAVRTSYDIANFLEKQERVKKFDAALADQLDESERAVLVDVLRNKLDSSRY